MKTFNDLKFKPHPHVDGVISRIQFDNGYGASVVKHDFSYGGKDGLYELAVIDTKGDLTYSTPVTNDVEGYLSEDDVTKLLEQIQQLPNA
jgi:hypothetical protein